MYVVAAPSGGKAAGGLAVGILAALRRIFLTNEKLNDTRLGKLQRQGVIAGFSVRRDWVTLGQPIHAYIDIKLVPGADGAAFEAELVETAGPGLLPLVAATTGLAEPAAAADEKKDEAAEQAAS